MPTHLVSHACKEGVGVGVGDEVLYGRALSHRGGSRFVVWDALDDRHGAEMDGERRKDRHLSRTRTGWFWLAASDGNSAGSPYLLITLSAEVFMVPPSSSAGQDRFLDTAQQYTAALAPAPSTHTFAGMKRRSHKLRNTMQLRSSWRRIDQTPRASPVCFGDVLVATGGLREAGRVRVACVQARR